MEGKGKETGPLPSQLTDPNRPTVVSLVLRRGPVSPGSDELRYLHLRGRCFAPIRPPLARAPLTGDDVDLDVERGEKRCGQRQVRVPARPIVHHSTSANPVRSTADYKLTVHINPQRVLPIYSMVSRWRQVCEFCEEVASHW